MNSYSLSTKKKYVKTSGSNIFHEVLASYNTIVVIVHVDILYSLGECVCVCEYVLHFDPIAIN